MRNPWRRIVARCRYGRCAPLRAYKTSGGSDASTCIHHRNCGCCDCRHSERRDRRNRSTTRCDRRAGPAGRGPAAWPLAGSRYPDPHVESLVKPKGAFGASGFPAFAGTMAVERVATGFRWAEGPVYFPAGRYRAVQRHSQQSHHALLRGRRPCERIPAAVDEFQRQHDRSRRPADHLRTSAAGA